MRLLDDEVRVAQRVRRTEEVAVARPAGAARGVAVAAELCIAPLLVGRGHLAHVEAARELVRRVAVQRVLVRGSGLGVSLGEGLE